MTDLPEFFCPRCRHSIDTHSLGEPCDVGGTCRCILTPRDIAAHCMGTAVLSAHLVKVNTHMGDHAQDVREAVMLLPNEPVEGLARRVLQQPNFEAPEYEWYLELRFARPPRW